LETAEREAVITSRPSRKRQKGALALATVATTATEPAQQNCAAFGAIEGTVQTLTSRHGLRFTIYDSLNDRAVSCYLEPGHEDIMREVWGKRAIIQGWITRDLIDGHPLAVRHITDVTPITTEGDYTKARAILPLGPDDPSPVGAIRRLRDG
jgi:hypothetical protein